MIPYHEGENKPRNYIPCKDENMTVNCYIQFTIIEICMILFWPASYKKMYIVGRILNKLVVLTYVLYTSVYSSPGFRLISKQLNFFITTLRKPNMKGFLLVKIPGIIHEHLIP